MNKAKDYTFILLEKFGEIQYSNGQYLVTTVYRNFKAKPQNDKCCRLLLFILKQKTWLSKTSSAIHFDQI